MGEGAGRCGAAERIGGGMSQDREFKPGDVVYLKSGGAPMTVRMHLKHGEFVRFDEAELGVHCDWIAEDGMLQKAVFLPEQLTDF